MPGARAPRRRRGALVGLLVGLGLLVAPAAVWAAGTTPERATGDRPAPAGLPPGTPPIGAGTPAASEVAAGPVRVRMARIGVDAPVLPVGVDERGELAVPADVRTVGWYRFGPRPGDPAGSSVLAGHVDDRVQGRGAFYRLIDAAVGDEVWMRLSDGTEQRYEVRAVERVEKSRLPVDDLFARDGPARLTLITCGGEFDRTAGRHRDNVVVRAIPLAP